MKTIDAATGEETRTTAADARRAGRTVPARDALADQAYQAGLAGEDWHHDPGDDPTIREAHRAGLDEHAKAGRARLYRRGRTVAAGSGRKLARSARRLPRQARSIGGGSWSAVGVGLAVLGVIALYLLLVNSTLTGQVMSGLLGAVTWFVAPRPLPI